MSDELKRKLAGLPDAPGCYLFRDAGGGLLYVGKAGSLRSRVRSYFQPGASHPPRTVRLVEEVADLEIILTGTEREALLLESNLIRRHRPRYNIRLKDDKEFPYLRLSADEPFPRVTLVRRVRQDRAAYFGPYLPASLAWRTLRMVPRFFQVANCHLPFDGKQRPCLYYHLDQCLAPCAGKADPTAYAARVAEVRLFLEGRHAELREALTATMAVASDVQDYERAARYRDLIASMDRLAERQIITTAGLEDGDYWAAHREDGQAMVELFRMREGRMSTRRQFRIDEDEPGEGFFDRVLPQYYLDHEVPPHVFLGEGPGDAEVLSDFLSTRRGASVRLRVPRRGVRRRFLETAARNARQAFEERFRAPHHHGVAVLEALRDLLDLPAAPSRIECLDVSHHHGRDPYTSVVVFLGGRPRRSEYRLYRPRRARGDDDPGTLAEVVRRRYEKLAREGRGLPDLVIVDGGRGQLAAARRVLEELRLPEVALASLAKREEEIFVGDGEEPLRLDRGSPVLHLVQRLRDEAHRFALRHHRAAGRRRARGSTLTRVPGVGSVLAKRLLRRFGSVAGVRSASREELESVVGPSRARALHRALHGRKDGPDADD